MGQKDGKSIILTFEQRCFMSLGFIGDLLFYVGLSMTIFGLLLRVKIQEKRSAEIAELLAKYIKQNQKH